MELRETRARRRGWPRNMMVRSHGRKAIAYSPAGRHLSNGRQTGIPEQQNRQEGFWPAHRKPAKMFRVGLYARVSTHDQQTLPHADARHAGVCGEARLDDRGSDQRGRFRRGASGNSARNCWQPPAAARSMWCWSGGWIAGAARSDLVATLEGTGTSGRRFRVAHRSTGSDHANGPRDGRVAGRFREFEHEILRERTKAGLAQARQKGQRLGRPVTAAVHAAEIRKLHRAGVSKSEIARRLEIGRTSVRRLLTQKKS